MASNCGTQPPNIEILQRFQNRYQNHWYVTNDTLHLNVPYVRDEIKRLRYADRMEKHPNILATNLMKRVKNLPDRIVICRAYATGYVLFKIPINCQMNY